MNWSTTWSIKQETKALHSLSFVSCPIIIVSKHHFKKPNFLGSFPSNLTNYCSNLSLFGTIFTFLLFFNCPALFSSLFLIFIIRLIFTLLLIVFMCLFSGWVCQESRVLRWDFRACLSSTGVLYHHSCHYRIQLLLNTDQLTFKDALKWNSPSLC